MYIDENDKIVVDTLDVPIEHFGGDINVSTKESS